MKGQSLGHWGKQELKDIKVLVATGTNYCSESISFALQKEGIQAFPLRMDRDYSLAMERFRFDAAVILTSGEKEKDRNLLKFWKEKFKALPILVFSENKPGECVSPAFGFNLLRALINELFPKKTGNQRESERLPISQSASWSAGDTSFRDGKIKNMSAKGAYLAAEGNIPKVGDVVSVEFYFESEDGFELFHGLGVVRWSDESDHGFGIEFVRLTEASRGFLEWFREDTKKSSLKAA